MGKREDVVGQILHEAQKQIDANFAVVLWNGERFDFGGDSKTRVTLRVASPDAIRQLLFAPSLKTVFEVYSLGLIDVENAPPLSLGKVIDHVAIMRFVRSYGRLRLLRKLRHFVFDRSEGDGVRAYDKTAGQGEGRDDEALVRFHYDLPTEFYRLFLDERMVYSCGYFAETGFDIHAAQASKLDMICRKLRLMKGQKLLDVGCGWGALICHAAENFGVDAVGVTLSQTQHDEAQQQIERRGLGGRVSVRKCDFREINEPEGFDRIAQIGMFEHVGRGNFDGFFEHIHRLLKPRGLYLHHAITRRVTPDPSRFDRMTHYQKVITRYIFPGGELDYIGRTLTNLDRHKFEVHDCEGWREHYAQTLEHWSDRLWEARAEAAELVGEDVVRLWLLYFALFAIAFDRGTVGIFQTLSSKRQVGKSGLPPTRADLYN